MDILLVSPRTASFHKSPAVRVEEKSFPALPPGYVEMENALVSVLAIDLPPGDSTVVVVFCPVWGSETVCEMLSVSEIVPLDLW